MARTLLSAIAKSVFQNKLPRLFNPGARPPQLVQGGSRSAIMNRQDGWLRLRLQPAGLRGRREAHGFNATITRAQSLITSPGYRFPDLANAAFTTATSSGSKVFRLTNAVPDSISSIDDVLPTTRLTIIVGDHGCAFGIKQVRNLDCGAREAAGTSNNEKAVLLQVANLGKIQIGRAPRSQGRYAPPPAVAYGQP